jgi:hypothetical protein
VGETRFHQIFIKIDENPVGANITLKKLIKNLSIFYQI